MNIKRKMPLVALSFFLSLLAFGIMPHTAFAANDACATLDANDGSTVLTANDPPGISGLSGGMGGWSGDSTYSQGQFQNTYQNALSHVVTNKMNSKHNMVQNSQSLDAQTLYCFSKFKALYDKLQLLMVSTSPTKLLFQVAIQAAVKLIAGIACAFAASLATTITQVLTVANNLLCLPIPKLKLPSLKIPGLPSTACHGQSLVKLSLNPPGTTAPAKTVMWKLWQLPHPTAQ